MSFFDIFFLGRCRLTRLYELLKQMFFELDFKLFGCGILNFRGNIVPYFRALIFYAFL